MHILTFAVIRLRCFEACDLPKHSRVRSVKIHRLAIPTSINSLSCNTFQYSFCHFKGIEGPHIRRYLTNEFHNISLCTSLVMWPSVALISCRIHLNHTWYTWNRSTLQPWLQTKASRWRINVVPLFHETTPKWLVFGRLVDIILACWLSKTPNANKWRIIRCVPFLHWPWSH